MEPTKNPHLHDVKPRTKFEQRPQTCCAPFLPMPKHPTPRIVSEYPHLQLRELLEPIDLNVPNCRHWCKGEVAWYFHHYFNELVAEMFYYHNIDGIALLLMKHHHVLFDMQFYFRKAHKRMIAFIPEVPVSMLAQVWVHVSCLQHRRNAFDLFFNGLMSMRSWGWKLHIVPGDHKYVGHPKDF